MGAPNQQMMPQAIVQKSNRENIGDEDILKHFVDRFGVAEMLSIKQTALYDLIRCNRLQRGRRLFLNSKKLYWRRDAVLEWLKHHKKLVMA